MTKNLPPDYLNYPRRKYGQDQDRYDWAFKPAAEGDTETRATLALIIPIERFVLNPKGEPFRAPGAMVTPYPDLRHFTTRDYGNRIGVFRLLKVFRKLDIKATFPINAALLKSIAPLVARIQKDGHMIAAYGLDMDCIHWGELDLATERAWVHETRALFDEAGLSSTTWMSPARQQSVNTLDVIAAHGFTTCLDWEFDNAPKPMRTRHGDVTMVPHLSELADRKILIEKRHSEAEWSSQLIEAATYSTAQSSIQSPQGFAVTITPYLSGLPFRIRAVEQTLEKLKSIVDFRTCEQIFPVS